MKKNILLFLTLTLFVFNCRKQKDPELNDPDWRKEFLEISYNICEKLESCLTPDDLSEIKKDLQNYAKSEIKPEKCNEKTKKSRIYLLKGENPQKIKEVARNCSLEIQKFSCEEIRSGAIKSSIPCEEMRKIQQGIE